MELEEFMKKEMFICKFKKDEDKTKKEKENSRLTLVTFWSSSCNPPVTATSTNLVSISTGSIDFYRSLKMGK